MKGKTRISDELNKPEFMTHVIDAGFVLSNPARIEDERRTEYDLQGPGVDNDGDYNLQMNEDGRVTAHLNCTNIFINPSCLLPSEWETSGKTWTANGTTWP